jgi:pimeloyl-[acyl-carrier protein] methyl ester esterase
MNSAVWDECISLLPDWINVVLIDLPGHGAMIDVHADSLDDYVKSLVSVVNKPAIWAGWSLGGQAVLRLAELYPHMVSSALLVATNPCFVSRPDWPCAVDVDVFDQFAMDLEKNRQKTIKRFLALQVKGVPDAMSIVRKLQESMETRGSASPEALRSGMNVLQSTDLRQNLTSIEAPLHWLLGGRDSLVPAGLAKALKKQLAQENVVQIEKSGHAPFISHQNDFINQLVTIAGTVRKS